MGDIKQEVGATATAFAKAVAKVEQLNNVVDNVEIDNDDIKVEYDEEAIIPIENDANNFVEESVFEDEFEDKKSQFSVKEAELTNGECIV